MYRRFLILLLLFICDNSYSQSKLNYTKVEVPEISSIEVKSIFIDNNSLFDQIIIFNDYTDLISAEKNNAQM